MTKNVERTSLAQGFDISRVVTGLWQVADMEREGETLDPRAMAAAMLPYVEAGLTTFDMADHYGSAEDIVGAFSNDGAETPVQLLTKWVPEPGPVSKAAVRAAVERSLTRMQTQRLELLQFHTWSYADPSWLDSLFYLQELKQEGLIANLGLTNFNTAHLRVAVSSGIEVVSNQVCFSLLDQRAKKDMAAFCLEHDIKLLAYGTVAGGLLTERWLGRPEPALNEGTWSQMKYKRFVREAGGWEVFQGLLRTLAQVAEKRGVSVANVASRFVLEHPAVGAVIIGARLGRGAHIGDTLNLFGFSLDDESRSLIEESLATLSPMPGDCGDEYRRPPFLTASGDLSHHLAAFPKPFKAVKRPDGKTVVLSGTPWEEIAGFCRAVRVGDRIIVSGTTATHRDRVIGGADAGAQTHFVIDKLDAALQSLGSRLEDVVRTRVYVKHMSDWEAVARAHGNRFGDVLPANTLVQAQLVGEDYLVEIEAEAVFPASFPASPSSASAS